MTANDKAYPHYVIDVYAPSDGEHRIGHAAFSGTGEGLADAKLWLADFEACNSCGAIYLAICHEGSCDIVAIKDGREEQDEITSYQHKGKP